MSGFSKPTQLPKGHRLVGFQSGEELIDSWAEKYAARARHQGTAVVYVSYYNEEIAGFYTLSTHSVSRIDISGGWLARNTPEQIPVLLLGMLGVDKKFQGQGLGAHLLKDAIENSLKIAELAGARALVVDPIGPSAESFYAHFGFTKIPGTHRMAIRLV